MKRIALAFLFLGAAGGSFFATCVQPVLAARNSSGTYSLPSGNPVTSNTIISPTWANNTLTDIGAELTNSLDRSGRGAMQAPLQCSSGTVSSPALSFSAEPNSGLYRAGSHDVRMSVNGSDIEKWSSTGVTAVVPFNSSGTASVAGDTVVDSGGANAGTFSSSGGDHGLHLGASSGEGITSRRTVGTGQFGLDLWATSINRLSATASGVQIPGEFATTPGTAISASYGATYNFAFGAMTAATCVLQAQTLTGVSVGGVCSVSVDGNVSPNVVDCYVSAANTVQIRACPLSNNTLNAGNFRVRVWQP